MESGQIPKTKTIKSAVHSDYMMKRLEKFYENEEFCDVTLIAETDDTQVNAHRGALAMASEFFLKMFSTEFKESKSKKIKLQDIDGIVLRLIIDFVYTASIKLSTELVHKIIVAAHFYQIDSLVDACCDFIEEQLTPGNCIFNYTLAEKYGWTRLQNRAIVVISQNFSSLAHDTQFLQLNQDQLCKLMKSDKFNVQTEWVFLSLARWFKHDEVSRKESMLPLLKNIRYSELSMKFISDNRRSVCKTDECNELIWNWMEWHLSSEEHSQIKARNTKSRKSCQIQKYIAVSWGGRVLHTLDRQSNRWLEKTLPLSLQNLFEQGYALTIAKNQLLLTGRGEFISINLKNLKVTNLPPMKIVRYNHSSVFLNGSLYLLGGHNDENELSCIEKYDFSNGTWEFIKLCYADFTQVAVLNNEIYTIDSKCMESLNTTTKEVLTRPSKIRDSVSFVMCAVNGYLYAVGYADNEINERYDPVAQSWCTIKSSPMKNENIKCIPYNNRLCVLGLNSDGIITSAEEYYPETNEWKTSEIPLNGSNPFIFVEGFE